MCILPIESAYKNCDKLLYFGGLQAAVRPFCSRTDIERYVFLDVSAVKKRGSWQPDILQKTYFFVFLAVSERGDCAANSLMDFFFSPCSRVPFF